MAKNVHATRAIANARIHVERVIGQVRKKYTILNGTLPLDFLTRCFGEDGPLIDKIVSVCCALTNLSDSVVPFE